MSFVVVKCLVRILKRCRATRFEVPLSFILQQAAWLYERQLSQVRDQMRRVGKGDASGNESDRSVGASPQQGVRLSNLAGEAGTLDGTASGVRQRRVSLDKNVGMFKSRIEEGRAGAVRGDGGRLQSWSQL